jgi:hypothetical protein
VLWMWPSKKIPDYSLSFTDYHKRKKLCRQITNMVQCGVCICF